MAKVWLARCVTAPLTAAVLTCILAGGVVSYIIHLENTTYTARLHNRAVERVAFVRARLEQQINLNLSALYAIEAQVAINKNFNDDVLRSMGAILTRNLPELREIQLSPGGIVRFIYPPAEAKGIRGLNLLALPGQKDVVLETIREGRIRIAGPLPLVQGGLGLVARDPIYVGTGSHRHFWGFATAVLDYSRLIRNIRALSHDPDMEFALRGKDGLGATGAVFFGQPGIFQDHPVTATVVLPSGSWQVAGRPRGGWLRSPAYGLYLKLLALIGVLGISVLVYLARVRGNRIKRLATTDTLTGALRRPAFMDRALAELQRARRYGRPLSLLMLDVDHFKTINDRFGHAAGDAALVALASCVADELRDSDAFARLGGEEFSVLCPETNLEQAQSLAERIRVRVEQSHRDKGTQTTPMTVSMGVACVHGVDTSFDAVLSAADRALYTAKGTGRNRVCVAN